jgi:hypothetical protein
MVKLPEGPLATESVRIIALLAPPSRDEHTPSQRWKVKRHIVFVMTTKPALGVSILVMAMAIALGLLWGLPLWRAPRVRARGAAARDCGDRLQDEPQR